MMMDDLKYKLVVVMVEELICGMKNMTIRDKKLKNCYSMIIIPLYTVKMRYIEQAF